MYIFIKIYMDYIQIKNTYLDLINIVKSYKFKVQNKGISRYIK